MKKLFIIFALLILSICVFADESYVLENKLISLNFIKNGSKNIVLKSLNDLKTNTNFIVEGTNQPIWEITCKKDNDFEGEKFTIHPSMAEEFYYGEKANTMVFTWKGAKNPKMNSGFDVVATITLKGENSYWNIEIAPNSEYGLWEIKYPLFTIDAKNNDEFMYPVNGSGRIYKEFDDPQGFPLTHPTSIPYSVEMGYYAQANLQLCSFTKDNSTLYICPEDLNSCIKTTNVRLNKPNEISYISRVYAPDSAKAGVGYKQAYSFNLAVVDGDWYNAAKKYRKWGIDNKFGVFANGKLEDRKDLPDWFKYNNLWFMLSLDTNRPNALKSMDDHIAFYDMPAICHIYQHQQYPYDTHYPNWLPIKEEYLPYYKSMQDRGIHIMPYTNGKLVDMNLSPTYKQYGEILLQKDENNKPYEEKWGTDEARNAVACIDSPYKDAYLNEMKELMKVMNYDAYYMDQIGGLNAFPCYNREHTHQMGGGDYIIKDYNKLLGELRKELSELKGAPVPLTTECAGEAFVFDGWLRINDRAYELNETPVNMVIYSDYAVNFGTHNNKMEFEKDNELPALNKTAITLCKGYQLGWYIGSLEEVTNGPRFSEHLKAVAKARESHVNYFNFGEMVRNVKITSDNPVKNIYFVYDWNYQNNHDFKLIKTCSFNYKGKTMVCFASVSDEPVKVDWESKACDLNLKDKSKYTITQTYVKGAKTNKSFKNLGKKGLVKSSFTIEPFDTVMFIVE